MDNSGDAMGEATGHHWQHTADECEVGTKETGVSTNVIYTKGKKCLP